MIRSRWVCFFREVVLFALPIYLSYSVSSCFNLLFLFHSFLHCFLIVSVLTIVKHYLLLSCFHFDCCVADVVIVTIVVSLVLFFMCNVTVLVVNEYLTHTGSFEIAFAP